MFLCIPIVYGCPAKLTQEGHDQIICPRCHNSGAQKFKQKKWFELCYVPLIPLGTKQIYLCQICNWRAAEKDVNVNDLPSAKGPAQYSNNNTAGTGGGQNYAPPAGRGYDVGYSTGGK